MILFGPAQMYMLLMARLTRMLDVHIYLSSDEDDVLVVDREGAEVVLERVSAYRECTETVLREDDDEGDSGYSVTSVPGECVYPYLVCESAVDAVAVGAVMIALLSLGTVEGAVAVCDVGSDEQVALEPPAADGGGALLRRARPRHGDPRGIREANPTQWQAQRVFDACAAPSPLVRDAMMSVQGRAGVSPDWAPT